MYLNLCFYDFLCFYDVHQIDAYDCVCSSYVFLYDLCMCLGCFFYDFLWFLRFSSHRSVWFCAFFECCLYDLRMCLGCFFSKIFCEFVRCWMLFVCFFVWFVYVSWLMCLLTFCDFYGFHHIDSYDFVCSSYGVCMICVCVLAVFLMVC